MKEINTKEMMKAYHSYKASCNNTYCSGEEVTKRLTAFKESSEKLTIAIKEAEGRASARTIDDFDVMKALISIENKLDLTKKDLEGVMVDVDIHSQKFPNAYKYIPESTQFSAIYKGGSWRIYDIGRYSVRQRNNATYLVDLTDKAKEAIIKNHSQFD